MKKLGHTAKPADKDDVKAKKVAEQVKVDSQFKMSSVGSKSRYSLFAGEKVQPSLQLTPVADSEEPKNIVEKKAAIPEDEVQTKPRSPLTILSEDEGYLLEDEQQIAKVGLSAEACGEFLTSEIKAAKPHKKKKRTVASYWRPKTRPTNKSRWSIKKILNPNWIPNKRLF